MHARVHSVAQVPATGRNQVPNNKACILNRCVDQYKYNHRSAHMNLATMLAEMPQKQTAFWIGAPCTCEAVFQLCHASKSDVVFILPAEDLNSRRACSVSYNDSAPSANMMPTGIAASAILGSKLRRNAGDWPCPARWYWRTCLGKLPYRRQQGKRNSLPKDRAVNKDSAILGQKYRAVHKDNTVLCQKTEL